MRPYVALAEQNNHFYPRVSVCIRGSILPWAVKAVMAVPPLERKIGTTDSHRFTQMILLVQRIRLERGIRSENQEHLA
jgi:hypothetical protein